MGQENQKNIESLEERSLEYLGNAERELELKGITNKQKHQLNTLKYMNFMYEVKYNDFEKYIRGIKGLAEELIIPEDIFYGSVYNTIRKRLGEEIGEPLKKGLEEYEKKLLNF